MKFDQWEFIDEEDIEISNLDEHGWLYYPDSCLSENAYCNLVVLLHDCFMRGIDMIQPDKGWTSIANLNHIVLLIP